MDEHLPNSDQLAMDQAEQEAFIAAKAMVENEALIQETYIQDVNIARQMAYASKDQREAAARQRQQAAKLQTYLEAGITTEGSSLTDVDRGEYLADKNHARMKAIIMDKTADGLERAAVPPGEN